MKLDRRLPGLPRRVAADPLLHFLIAGALLFAAYTWFGSDEREQRNELRISAAEVSWLQQAWARQRGREPDEQELKGLLADHVKEVLLAREAKELELDRDDTVVRRRLAQKMEFLLQDTARIAQPREEELRALYASQPQRYRMPVRVSFRQIYFATVQGARSGLATLRSRNESEVGDPSLLERDYAAVAAEEIANVFGPEFARALLALEPGAWSGPIASAYGHHLVRLERHLGAEPRAFEDVRPLLVAEWERAAQGKARAAFFTALLKKYDVVVESTTQPLLGALTEVRP